MLNFSYTLQDTQKLGDVIYRIAPNETLLRKVLKKHYPNVDFEILEKYELIDCEACG